MAPPGFTSTARQAIAAADATTAIAGLRRDHRNLEPEALVWGGWRWEVGYFSAGTRVATVDVSAGGTVLASWTGVQAAAYFARHPVDRFRTPWLILVAAVLFVAPFFDRRRPLRIGHLDLLAMLAFTVPLFLLQGRHGTAATWSLYVPLVSLFIRLLVLARPGAGGRLTPRLPMAVLAVGLVALAGGRVALNVTADKVIDVGYTSVVGADRLAHDEELYVDNDAHGDTYGPFNYIAYVPFELALPWDGTWDTLPAAHAAAIAFDLMTVLALFVLGGQLRSGREGRRLGLALGWAWCAFPFTLLGVMESSNDGLVAMLVAWTLVALSRPALRGALLGLAASAKFFPLAVLGAVWRGGAPFRSRPALVSAGACAGVFALSIALYLPDGGLRELWNCTIGYQLSRPPDFTLWGEYGARPLQLAIEGAAVLLAAGIAFFPAGERSLRQVAALAGAVTIATQISGGHWFFYYVIWFTPFVLLAMVRGDDVAAPRPAASGEQPRRLVLVAA